MLQCTSLIALREEGLRKIACLLACVCVLMYVFVAQFGNRQIYVGLVSVRLETICSLPVCAVCVNMASNCTPPEMSTLVIVLRRRHNSFF